MSFSCFLLLDEYSDVKTSTGGRLTIKTLKELEEDERRVSFLRQSLVNDVFLRAIREPPATLTRSHSRRLLDGRLTNDPFLIEEDDDYGNHSITLMELMRHNSLIRHSHNDSRALSSVHSIIGVTKAQEEIHAERMKMFIECFACGTADQRGQVPDLVTVYARDLISYEPFVDYYYPVVNPRMPPLDLMVDPVFIHQKDMCIGCVNAVSKAVQEVRSVMRMKTSLFIRLMTGGNKRTFIHLHSLCRVCKY